MNAKFLIFAAAIASLTASADYSLIDNEKWFRSGGDAENVVWGQNKDGTKNVTLIQEKDGKDVSIGSNFDMSKFAGKDIEFVIVADGENVVRGYVKDKPRDFMPIMTHYEVQFGEYGHYRRNNCGEFPEGTFKNREIVYPFIMPKTGHSFGLNLYSNCESGKVTIKKFYIREVTPYLDRHFKIPVGYKCEYSDKVLKYYDGKHFLRGIVAGENFKEDDYVKMRGWGANLLRFWCSPRDFTKVDALLPVINKLGFKVILQPWCPGGKGNRMGYDLFRNEDLYKEYLANMRSVAEHFKDDDRIFAIGLMNEPFQPLREPVEDPHFFLNVEYEAAKIIRSVDPDRVIVASATGGGSPGDYALSDMRPLPMKDVIYEMHFYSPMFLSHLGLFGNKPGPDVHYPGGSKRGTTWTKETLRECMGRMDDFEKTYGAKIFVGEFSCKNNTPGAAQWLDDVCDLLDERGYIWTFHDYGEYPGWNLEYRSDCPDAKPVKLLPGQTGDRLEVMKKQWAKNPGEKPYKPQIPVEVAMPLTAETIANKANGAPLDSAFLIGRLEKDKMIYKVGEEIVFSLSLVGAGEDIVEKDWRVMWQRFGEDGNDEQGFAPLPIDKPLIIRTKSAKPGAVRIVAQVMDQLSAVYRKNIKQGALTPDGTRPMNGAETYDKRVFFDGTAFVEPEKAERVAEPPDFDAFWAKQKARLAAVPLKVIECEDIHAKGPNADVFKVKVSCAGARPMTGYLSRPKFRSREGRKFPAVVEFEGYGCNRPWQYDGGVGQRQIMLKVNAHGYELGQDQRYYQEYGQSIKSNGRDYAFDPVQNSDPETAYFNGMALRLMRALEYIKTIPEWDGTNLVVRGGSQGGLQAIWAAGLDSDVTEVFASIPWCCDFCGEKLGHLRGPWFISGTDALKYYDPVNHAKRINPSATVSIPRAGLGDYTCPPLGVWFLYESIPCTRKSIHWVQGSSHGFVPPPPNQFFDLGCK